MADGDRTGSFDTIVRRGLFFDGQQTPSTVRDIGIKDGLIAAISEEPLLAGPDTEVIDAEGRWVTPGFIDLHTHYDAEVEVDPSLSESVRHGVTTVMLGSCSLSLALGTPRDLADMFCRVEAIPYDVVLPLLENHKDWDGHASYFEHLERLPLGPNVASFVGHSAVRAHVMGIEASVDKTVRPTTAQLEEMDRLLEEGLDLGYIGASVQTLPWDKMGGSRDFRSRPLPSTFAKWSEVQRWTKILRRRQRIFQGVPNVSTKWNVILFLLASMGLMRKALKTTVISMMEIKSAPGIHKVIGTLSRFFNKVLGADFRFQALPEIFDLWADGIDLVVFEEFGAGAAALHVDDAMDRKRLLEDPAYRKWFRKQWESRFLPKAFHRDFNESEILSCPDKALEGRSFADVASERGQHPTDTFLDLVAQYGTDLRWYTVMANWRTESLEWIVSHPDILIGFSDAGAHLRQMAHYNFGLRLIRLVLDAERRGQPFMSREKAVWRLTGEIGDWLGLDVGTLAVGKQADLVVLNPDEIDGRTEAVAYAAIPGYGGYERLVRRHDSMVDAVLVRGRRAISGGQPVEALGQEHGFGRLLRHIEVEKAQMASRGALSSVSGG
jgi:N-acyl-D-aspartate/D-glutamate deacylase